MLVTLNICPMSDIRHKFHSTLSDVHVFPVLGDGPPTLSQFSTSIKCEIPILKILRLESVFFYFMDFISTTEYFNE